MGGKWSAISKSYLYDAAGNPIESSDGSLSVSQHNEAAIHEGIGYLVNHFFGTIAINNTVNILIDVPAGTIIHYWDVFYSTGATELEVFRDPTVTDPGTALRTINRRSDLSTESPNVNFYHTATVSDNGLTGFHNWWGSGKSVGGPTEEVENILVGPIKVFFIVTARANPIYLTYNGFFVDETGT